MRRFVPFLSKTSRKPDRISYIVEDDGYASDETEPDEVVDRRDSIAETHEEFLFDVSHLNQRGSSDLLFKPEPDNPKDIGNKRKMFYVIPNKYILVSILLTLFISVLIYLLVYRVELAAGHAAGSLVGYLLLRMIIIFTHKDKMKTYIDPADLRITSIPEKCKYNLIHYLNESKEDSSGAYQGWLNVYESQDYNLDSYHIKRTEPCFCRLEGYKLTIKKPLDEITCRSIWSEKTYNKTFVSQIRVDVRSFTVALVPDRLTKFQITNKKYPIVLTNIKSTVDSPKQAGTLFENVSKAPQVALKKIILFGRCGPEKYEWYRRLYCASHGYLITTNLTSLIRKARHENDREQKLKVLRSYTVLAHRDSEDDVNGTEYSQSTQDEDIDSHTSVLSRPPMVILTEYMQSMMRVMTTSLQIDDDRSLPKYRATQSATNLKVKSRNKTEKKNSENWLKVPTASLVKQNQRGKQEKLSPNTAPEIMLEKIKQEEQTGTAWLNVLICRLLFDFLREDKWKNWILMKIQKKLNKIDLPYYIAGLRVVEVNRGKELPLIKHVSPPRLEDSGLWIDLFLSFSGDVNGTLETSLRLDLLKRKKYDMYNEAAREVKSRRVVSVDGKFEDFIITPLSPDPTKGTHGLTRFCNYLVHSRLFQLIARSKTVSKFLDNITSTPLRIKLHLYYLSGCISINIPPPPSNIIWFGFKSEPRIIINVKPTIGKTTLTVYKICRWIEEKIREEIHTELIIPNMEFVTLPFMQSNVKLKHSTGQKSTVKLKTAPSSAASSFYTTRTVGRVLS